MWKRHNDMLILYYLCDAVDFSNYSNLGMKI